MISLCLGWNGCIRGSIPLASHCLSNTKNKKRIKIFSGLNTFRHFFNTGQADRPCSNKNPANLRKKDVKNPLSY